MGTDTAAPFGALLRRYRRRAGLTQEQLAERARLSDRAVGDLERMPDRLPRLETATLLAEALGLRDAEREAFLTASRGDPPAPTTPAVHPAAQGAGTLGAFPVTLTPLVAREHEEAAIAHLLAAARLLTLTGPGGVGKTRLALRAAATLGGSLRDGAVVVALAGVEEPAGVLPAIAAAMELKDEGTRSAVAGLSASLRDRQLLLVLDNFEQVAAAAPALAALLVGCPDVRALVTSRVPLRVQGEQEFAVRPLAVPQPELPWDALRQSPAVQLFEQRARAVQPDFALTAATAPVVAAICRRLDGLPLALELAAARLKLLPPAALLKQLERGLGALGGGGPDRPDRQRTLRATLAWSYALLSPAQRALFRRLCVFVGGCTLEMAEAVSPSPDVLDGLSVLVDHGLVYLMDTQAAVLGGSEEVRYALLETVRAYGWEQLEAQGDREAAQRVHAACVVALAEQAETELYRAEQSAWLRRLQREHGNLRAALQWAQEHGEVDAGLRIVGALLRFWELHGHLHEALGWLESLLPRVTDENTGALVRAKALRAGGIVAYRLADYATAQRWLEQALAVYRGLDERRGTANVLNNLGNVALAAGDPTLAAWWYEQSVTLSRALGDRTGVASALNNLAEARRTDGRNAEAAALYEESLTLYQEVGDTWSIASLLNNLGGMALDRGDTARATALYERSLALRRQLGNEPGIALVLSNLARATLKQGDARTAADLYAQGLAIHHRLDARMGIAQCCEGLAAVACAQDDPARGVALFSAAAALREASSTPLPPSDRAVMAALLATARRRLGDAGYQQAEVEGLAWSQERLVADALALARP